MLNDSNNHTDEQASEYTDLIHRINLHFSTARSVERKPRYDKAAIKAAFRRKLERETRLELATPTLARSCSTN